jgi:hypothetical protein
MSNKNLFNKILEENCSKFNISPELAKSIMDIHIKNDSTGVQETSNRKNRVEKLIKEFFKI